LKKRTKKLLAVLSRIYPVSARQRTKSFLLLFFKKEGLPAYLKYSPRLAPSNRPLARQHALKPAAGAARAHIVTAELFDQLLFAVHHAQAAFDLRFGVEIPSGACSSFQKQ
jgi:hypothetical protein